MFFTSENRSRLLRKQVLNLEVHLKHLKIREKLWADFYFLMDAKETGFFSNISKHFVDSSKVLSFNVSLFWKRLTQRITVRVVRAYFHIGDSLVVLKKVGYPREPGGGKVISKSSVIEIIPLFLLPLQY